MIPKVSAQISPYDNRTINIVANDKQIPSEVMVWLQRRVENRYQGEPMVLGIVNHINSYIGSQLSQLINNRYIFDIGDKWILCKPLFRWVKG